MALKDKRKSGIWYASAFEIDDYYEEGRHGAYDEKDLKESLEACKKEIGDLNVPNDVIHKEAYLMGLDKALAIIEKHLGV